MNILVTGSNGQLGQSLRRIVDCGDNAVTEYPRSRFEYQGNTWIFTSQNGSVDTEVCENETLHLTSESIIEDFVLTNKINVIINCAAYTDVNGAETIKKCMDAGENVDDEVYWLNVDVPKWLANAAKLNGAVLIHFSTDYVFNGQTFMPYKEDRLKLPLNYYGKTKSLGEDEVVNSGCHYIIIRTQWLYSPYRGNFVKTMYNLLSDTEEKDIAVVDDQIGTPTSAFYLALDLTKLIYNNNAEIRSLSQTGIYHYSADGVCSWYDVANAVRNYKENVEGPCAVRIVPRHSDINEHVRRPLYGVLNTDKFYETFHIEKGSCTWWKDQLNETLYVLSHREEN